MSRSDNGKTGILLVNLGTPDAPSFFSIRRYLKEFLADPRVVEGNRILWWLILNGIILNIRPFKLIKLYRSIWTSQGSPLLVESQRQVQVLQEMLGESYVVALGMRYGNPSLKRGLLELREANVSKVIILPLYPQYSGATTGSTFDAVTRLFESCRHIPCFRFIPSYYDNPAYIHAMKVEIEAFWSAHGKPEKLILSYHGLPKEYCDKGDPYSLQCQKTSYLLAESLGLASHEWALSFQSRVGPKEWLTPYTDEFLKSLPSQGVHDVHVFCPGFSVDCLETLEEVALRNKEFFIEAGGKSYEYIRALNHSAAHIEMMKSLIVK